MNKEHLGHFIFFDKAGNAVGVGERVSFSEPVKGKRGAVVTQTVTIANGAASERKEEVDEATIKDIKDANKKLSLKDFKIAKL